ncbi:AraC family transcriptional regulator [Mannheimia bovis]|uniref:AraC family transcriptional regulator n=1 Tax=Mannheimia bovis TaxID=2770636 RepID=A0A7H1C0B1_9PAST|nr:AraC family transcriptional regulator [Mannheimia bovis]QNS14416.1 AraC family transcriptional regulator [Mannheimia bovis]
MFEPQLIQNIIQIAPKNEIWHTPITGLFVHCCDMPTIQQAHIQEPSICLVLQQQRQICLGEQCYIFGDGQFMFCPVNLPLTIEIPDATQTQPYLGISMKIDLTLLGKVLAQVPKDIAQKSNSYSAFEQWQLTQELSNAFSRLLELLTKPQDIDFLAPLIQKEIYYRLLQSLQGEKLKNLLEQGSHTHIVAQASLWIEQNLNQAFSVESLAHQSGMSVSGFHSHFKKITGMSPLQYQKRLRLTTAQRLIKLGKDNIATIAYQVGYESPSQFSREYSRHFGHSPRGDLEGRG